MRKLGFGIMGPGNIARKFAEAVKETDTAFLAAVASKSMEKAREFAGKFDIPAFYDSYEAMCANPAVDVVYIATTNNFHYDNILTSIANRKHVLCEKPMVLTRAQAEDVFAKAKENGVFVMEAMWSRFLPSISKAKELIDTGVIGEVRHIASSFNFFLPYTPDSRLVNKALGGGVLYDLGVYCISLSMFFAGEKPDSCCGYAHISLEGTDISDTVVMKFPSGATASFTCGIEGGSLNEMVIHGSKGSLRLHNRFLDSHKVDLFRGETLEESFDFPFGNGFVFQIRETIRCIHEGKLQSGIVSWQDTLDCITVIEKLLLDWGVE